MRQLRTVLEALRTKASERVWLRNQASGELDDSRLLDGAAGERLVFRRRGDAPSSFNDPNQANDDDEVSHGEDVCDGIELYIEPPFCCQFLPSLSFFSLLFTCFTVTSTRPR